MSTSSSKATPNPRPSSKEPLVTKTRTGLFAEPAPDWRERAMCRTRSPLLYDLAHLDDGAPYTVRAVTARALCAGCPVLRDCAADAWHHEDLGVVRGGVYLRTPQSPDLFKAATGIEGN